MISSDISKAAALLTKGELVAIPTETVYGLAANIYDESALKKIFALKKRPLYNPLIVHIASTEKVVDLVSYMPQKAKQLAQAFWPGSLTLILKKKEGVPDIITAGKDTVGVRVPDHPVTQALLQQLPFPVAAPSANPFGHISPTSPQHVAQYFKEGLHMVLDGGDCANGIESTIIGFEEDTPVLYRLGAISIEEIEKIVGSLMIKNKKETAPEAPGMLSRHYAPDTHTFLVENVNHFVSEHWDKKIGVLTFTQIIEAPQIVVCKPLSIKGNYKEAAANLYKTLHELDAMKLDMIVAQRFPEKDLGKAINDRLMRATKRHF